MGYLTAKQFSEIWGISERRIIKLCKEERINKLTVCYTKQKPIKFDCKTIGSVLYDPVSMACSMCSKVINDIIS